MKISFFGSSLVSAYWNGAATYYRGIIRALHESGHHVTFYEPDVYDRQEHRDIADPEWAKVVVYSAESEESVRRAVNQATDADVVVKTSGVGAYDALLEEAVLEHGGSDTAVLFWDVDAPATLERVEKDADDPFRPLIARYDAILTYGGGPPVIHGYEALGAKRCVPIYNALDSSTHHPVPKKEKFEAHVGFVGNRLPDREERVDEFFFKPAAELPDTEFLLAGSGWDDKEMPANVNYIGHLYTRDHNAFNSSCRVVLNITRESMARYGFSPPTRVFEAAGAAACLMTDAWEGIEQFLEPDEEVLLAENAGDVIRHVREVSKERAENIGEAARRRILKEHTYSHRATDMERVLNQLGLTKTKGEHASW